MRNPIFIWMLAIVLFFMIIAANVQSKEVRLDKPSDKYTFCFEGVVYFHKTMTPVYNKYTGGIKLCEG